MSQAKNPYVSITKQSASLPSGLDDQKLLVIGQKIAAGTAIEKTLYTDVERGDIEDLVGLQSMLGAQLSAVFDIFDQAPSPNLPRVDIIPLEDGAGTKAKYTVTFSGTADKAGTIDFNICGEEVSLTVAVDDDPSTDQAADLKAAIDLLELPLEVTDNGDGSVDIEAANDGTSFNAMTIKIDGLAKSGSDYYLGSLQVELSSITLGATDPTLTSLLDVVSKIRYQTMTYPYQYGTDLATDFLDSRFNVANAIKDGVAILKGTDSKTDLVTALGLLNSQSLVILCNKEVAEDLFKGGEDLELDFVAAARVAATRAVRLTTDANIVNFTPASVQGNLDAYGGLHIASLPYFNTPIFGSPLQPEGRGWSDTDITDIRNAGGCIMGNNTAGNQVILDQIYTTYKTDAAGNSDTTWEKLNTVDTMSVCAEYIFNNLKTAYAQSRLTAGNLVRGYSMTNESDFTSKMLEYFEDLGDYALVPKSKEASKYFVDNMSVTISMSLGRITSSNEFPIVVQLREILSTIKTNFASALV